MYTIISLCGQYREHFYNSKIPLTLAFSGSLQVAKRSVGGDFSLRKCFTNSNPIPRLDPVIKTVLGDNMAIFSCVGVKKHTDNV